jgi:hypothetical protein
MLNRHSRWVLALAVLMASSATGWADDAHKPAAPASDDDLLEFLGSVDTASDSAHPDDGSWIDYLSQADINRIARPNPTVVAVKPPGPPPKPSTPTPGTKQDE